MTKLIALLLEERNTSHPPGANPCDAWEILTKECETGLWDIPACNAKTNHPCQFPVELAERLILASSNEGGLVLDPFGGTGSTVLAALKHGRKGIMCERVPEYI